MSDGYVLAMYDVRGKQNFIFRTNKLQEIVGGSWIIRDLFDDYLFSVAQNMGDSKGIFSYKKDGNIPFTREGFEDHITQGYLGEVVYDGGGNFLVAFKSEGVFREVTYRFTKCVMEHIGTLKILATCVPVSDNDFSNYKVDNKKLYAKHRIAEAEESNIAPWSAIPIVQIDKKTSCPLVEFEGHKDISKAILGRIKGKGIRGKVTKESFAKLKKFYEEYDRIHASKNEALLSELEKRFARMNEDILDRIVEEKGKDSNLAVVYIDGNGMGAKVQNIIRDRESYEDCAAVLREFSEDIQKVYVEEGIKAALGEVASGDGESFRVVVSAGDEINFIVKARDAFECAKSYLDYLEDKEDASACAGIAVFHSHAPYADAYRIAEEACESGKKKMKELGITNASFIDFHIIQGAIGTSLEDIRKAENGDVISRPWLLWSRESVNGDADLKSYDEIQQILSTLSDFSRSNIKRMASAAKSGSVELEMELNRMYAHLPDKKKARIKAGWNKLKSMDEKRRRDIIYDISIAYDLWFSGKERKGDNKA